MGQAGGRLFRFLALCFLIAATVVAVLAWQAWHEKATAMISAFMASHGWTLPVLTKAPVSSDQVATRNELSSGLQRQLETMATDLAAVRRTVDQIAAKQEQMAKDVTALQAIQQSVSEKMSPPLPPPAPPRRNPKATAHPVSSVPPPLEPVPSPRPLTPPPSPPE